MDTEPHFLNRHGRCLLLVPPASPIGCLCR